jgi:hypothetical protein
MSLEVFISSYLIGCNYAIKIRFVTFAITKMAEKRQRVLSIQSHVVSGYVGNKSATFPLQVNIRIQASILEKNSACSYVYLSISKRTYCNHVTSEVM